MEERELSAIIEQEFSHAIGQHTGDLAQQRAQELKYYNSELFGNERDGESQVVSSDVFDTVEGMLPQLLRIFTSSDEVVRFDPFGPEDEEKAKQRTDVVNYIFYKQNNGFLILYEWFKDALINKNGVVKYWWDHSVQKVLETYEGLSEGQYLKLKADPNVEFVEENKREDEDEVSLRQERFDSVLKTIELKFQGQPQLLEQAKMQMQAELQAMPVPYVYDVKVRVSKDKSKVCVEVVPPEEFFISAQQQCVSIQDTPFCGHKRKMRISQLRSMGCPEEILSQIGGTAERDWGEEALARQRFTDEWVDKTPSGEANREAWVYDLFIQVDFDDDDIAELRHVIKVESHIWINEETDHINFAALTPIIMPHRFIGKSVAELVMADQYTKSTIWRQILNNLYLTNNPRKAVLSSASGVVQANLDDLMVSRPGAIMREYVPNAIRNEEVPFVAGASFPMLEYIDSQKEIRTGQTRYNQGTDADSLNKTARGIQMIQQASQQRGDLIARIFAETGVKDLMRGIAYIASKYSTKAMTVKLRNKWVEVDPREWKDQYDMTVNVALGSGNQDAQIAYLERVGVSQMELMQTGRGYLVTDQNVYNLHSKRAEAMGFKHPEQFISAPESVQKPPPQVPPEIIKIQTDAQIDQAKIQSTEKQRAFDAQTQQSLAKINSQTQLAIANMNNQSRENIEKMKINANSQETIFNANKEVGVKQLEHGHQLAMADKEAQAAKSEGVSYDKETGYAGKVMAVKQDAENQMGQHVQTMMEHSNQQSAQTAQVVAAVGDGLMQILAQFAQGMQGIQQQLAMQTQIAQQELVEDKKARTVSISNVQTDDKGRITGATIN